MKTVKIVIFFLAVVLVGVFIWLANTRTSILPSELDKDSTSRLEDSITFDPTTGLVADKNLPLIIANCTACHSGKLIQQHRFSREGWVGKIRWMQENHNLWNLGSSEQSVLDYLEKYYSPKSAANKIPPRRAPLKDIQWYKL